MDSPGTQRRLAAILASDMAGFSRLVQIDEEGTLSRQRSHRDELIDPTIAAYRGRIVKSTGDGLLVEFPSVVDAFRCAVTIQLAMPEREAHVFEDQRIAYRIGINIGDIVIDDDDIYGDGVNIASRLEALAEAGGICVSRIVFDQLNGKVNSGFEYRGAQKVKNIVEPIRVYQAKLRPEAPPAAPAKSVRKPVQKRASLIAALLVGLAAAGSIAYWYFRPAAPAKDSPPLAAEPLSDRPTIAVLPFDNLSGDPEQDYFSDGMSEDLITDLSKISGLTVIARNSSFAYKGESIDVRQVAVELGVRYVLEGSVRKVGDQVRINAQLIDGQTGGHLWADRYDGDLTDIFGLQDKVTAKIVTTLALTLSEGEKAKLDRRQTDSTEAYDTFLKGWEQFLRQTPESFGKAITLFERAVDLDPDYSRAYAALAATYWQIWRRSWGFELAVGLDSLHEPQFIAERFLERAMVNPTPLALQTAASMYSQYGRHSEAISAGERAIALDPNDADSYVALAGSLNLAGEFGRAVELVEHGMQLNPYSPSWYLYELGLARFGLEQFDLASESLEKALALNPEDRWSMRVLLASYGYLGREQDARSLFGNAELNVRGMDPLSITGVSFWYPFKNPQDAERLAEGLRKANVPD